MSDRIPSLGRADLDWQSDSVPFSTRFGDIYYSPEDGLGECRHVFLRGNDLPQRWRGRSLFTIGETGFGTGLNFLAAWALWRETASPGARLHYMSVEGFPLSRAELQQALTPWKALGTLRRALIDAYPTPHPGFHRIHVADDVYLTLLLGEAAAQLAEAEARVDAWFLDGFSPQKNPDMWRDEVFAEMARLSAPDATVATFTVAGRVRRGLAQAGFAVEKAPGFGTKREMLRGRFRGLEAPSRMEPWYRLPAGRSSGVGDITIVGGGIAGASIAYAFRRRGWTVRVREAAEAIARGASGNAAALVVPRLASPGSVEGRVHGACYLYAARELHKRPLADCWIDTPQAGALQLASSAAVRARFESYRQAAPLPEDEMCFVAPDEASGLAGLALDRAGIFFAKAGIVDPVRLCAQLVSQAEVTAGAPVDAVAEEDDQLAVIAAGHRSISFDALKWLPLRPVRGQVSLLPEDPGLGDLRLPLSCGYYVTPVLKQAHLAGASFERIAFEAAGDLKPTQSEHEEVISGVREFLPGYDGADPARIAGRVGIRAVTPDSLPLVGFVPDADFYRAAYEDLSYGRQYKSYQPARYVRDLLCHTGLGARGFVTSLLCAELLASQVCGEVWPVERRVALALHPARFLIRDIKRGRSSAK